MLIFSGFIHISGALWMFGAKAKLLLTVCKQKLTTTTTSNNNLTVNEEIISLFPRKSTKMRRYILVVVVVFVEISNSNMHKHKHGCLK